jgi:hypothetical protein
MSEIVLDGLSQEEIADVLRRCIVALPTQMVFDVLTETLSVDERKALSDAAVE